MGHLPEYMKGGGGAAKSEKSRALAGLGGAAHVPLKRPEALKYQTARVLLNCLEDTTHGMGLDSLAKLSWSGFCFPQ
jgi:hypothetical protein